jgi:hypothetical protein
VFKGKISIFIDQNDNNSPAVTGELLSASTIMFQLQGLQRQVYY